MAIYGMLIFKPFPVSQNRRKMSSVIMSILQLNPCISSEVLCISQQFVGVEVIRMNLTFGKRMIHAGGGGIKLNSIGSNI